jgi:3',5'-cyclic AMP phosphodiesterase CpdA
VRIHTLCLVAAFSMLAAPVARADSPFVEGPYVDRLTVDTATVHVRTLRPVPVTVVFTVPNGTLERTSPAAIAHRIIVSELPPDANVTYEVRASGYRTATGSFRTPPAVGARPIDFVALGDCRDGGARHGAVIRSVQGTPDFLLHLGDMVPRGFSLDEWTEFFQIAAPLLKRTAIVPVLGNHELISPGGAELYREEFALPDQQGRAYYRFEFGGVRIIVLDSNESLEVGSRQHAFALRELERASTDGNLQALFVAVHHGPMSSGRHGGLVTFRTSGLIDAMRRARVDLVISGHDHMYERGDEGGLKYIVTGGCGSPLYHPNRREPYQLAFVPTFHHVRFGVSAERIDLEVIRPDGGSIERCHFQRGTPFDCRGAVASVETPPTAQGPVEGVTPSQDLWDRYGFPLVVLVVALAIVGFLLYRWRRMRSRDPS